MVKRHELLAMQSGLQVAKAARATKITEEGAISRRLSESISPSAEQMRTAAMAEPSYDTGYINWLNRIINSTNVDVIDLTTRGR